MTDYASDWQQQ